jgi:hypothetical protein
MKVNILEKLTQLVLLIKLVGSILITIFVIFLFAGSDYVKYLHGKRQSYASNMSWRPREL